MHLSHILNALGEDREHYFNAVSPPIVQTSNFVFNTVADARQAFADEMATHVYTRGNNPTVEILRKKLAALEGSEDALVFASGVAAVAAAVLSQVKAGDHIVCVNKPYGWTTKLISVWLARFNVEYTFVDGTSMANIEAALRPNTTVLYLESPNSLTFELQDLEACAQLARSKNIVTIIDNSHCSPLYQNPIAMGIDIVVHSGTKYINGHSDVVVGVLCSSQKIVKQIFESELMTIGGILPPQEAALVIRGLRTIHLRVQRSNDSALKIAQWLETHPKVEKVIHPMLPSFPQYALAQKQMRGNGGLFSVYFKASSMEAMERFANNLEGFLMAVSWGGHESLIIPGCMFYNVPGKPDSTLPWNFVRFYIGLEDADWLMERIEKALNDL